jgi:hypothetical protein
MNRKALKMCPSRKRNASTMRYQKLQNRRFRTHIGLMVFDYGRLRA